MFKGHLSKEQKTLLYKLLDEGKSVRTIGKAMDISYQTVMYWKQVRNGTVLRTKDRYPTHKIAKPVKRYVDYLWEGYQRDHDKGTLIFLKYRYPKFYYEKTHDRSVLIKERNITLRFV